MAAWNHSGQRITSILLPTRAQHSCRNFHRKSLNHDQAKMRTTSIVFGLAAILAGAQASFMVRSAPAEDNEDMIVTWTKPGRLFRAREITIAPTTVTEVTTIVPTATFQLRSVEPTIRNTKRAFLNGWSPTGCAKDDDKIPASMESPFPYQLDPADISGASCMHYCGSIGNSLAATQNGNECWCGELEESLNYIDKSACDVPCAGEPGEMCGGKHALSIYSRAG